MRQSSGFVCLAVAAALLWRVGVGQALPQQPVRAELVEKIQKVLAELPYYGLFDHLVFELEEDRVTLGGYAFQPVLKTWAEREVSRVGGVAKVDNQIEVLPASTNDDRIRMAVFRAIYKEPDLAGYGFGGEPLLATSMRSSTFSGSHWGSIPYTSSSNTATSSWWVWSPARMTRPSPASRPTGSAGSSR